MQLEPRHFRRIRFVATTRWSDFELFGSAQQARAMRAATYFVDVMRSTHHGALFDAAAVRVEALACRAWLAAELLRVPAPPDEAWDAHRWSDDAWEAHRWSQVDWLAFAWVAHRWSSDTWASAAWDEQAWSAHRWSAHRWSDYAWSAHRWSAHRWSVGDWSAHRWSVDAWSV